MSGESRREWGEMEWWRKPVHRAIKWYLVRCGGAFHTGAYGPDGRYVVLVRDSAYGAVRAAGQYEVRIE